MKHNTNYIFHLYSLPFSSYLSFLQLCKQVMQNNTMQNIQEEGEHLSCVGECMVNSLPFLSSNSLATQHFIVKQVILSYYTILYTYKNTIYNFYQIP